MFRYRDGTEKLLNRQSSQRLIRFNNTTWNFVVGHRRKKEKGIILAWHCRSFLASRGKNARCGRAEMKIALLKWRN